MSDRPTKVAIEERIQSGETGLIELIPADRYVLRRIVAARALRDPETGKRVFTWPRLATSLGADILAVKRWHAQGIELILKGVQNVAV